jgi:uncharacterized iron-regulated membrane protein
MSIKTNSKTSESSSNAMLLLITRLHFYIGLFIGPFIFVAALTGTIYVITPQIENALYKDVLTTQNIGKANRFPYKSRPQNRLCKVI